MGINISQIKNQNLKELANLVDNSFNDKTRGNGVIDDCELSVFIDKAKKFGMESECAEILGLSKTTQNNNVQNVKAEQVAVKKNATTVKQGTVKKSKPNKLELQKKINKKKEEIKQITKKINDTNTSTNTKAGAALGGVIGFGLGGLAAMIAAPAVPFLGALAIMATPAAVGAAVGTGVAYLGSMFNDTLDAEDLKLHPKLAEELRKAEQELQVLEKQYNEYK